MTVAKDRRVSDPSKKFPDDALYFRIRWAVALGKGTESTVHGDIETENQILKNYTLEFTWTLVGAIKTLAVIGSIVGAVVVLKQKYFP